MPRPGGHLIEVELDDELAPQPRPERTRWSSRAWSWVVSVLAVALALAAGVHASQAASWGARYPGTGLTTDLTMPRHLMWSAPGYPIGVVGDLLLAGSTTGEGVAALRVSDGQQVWQHDGGYCSLVDLDGGYMTSSQALDPVRSRVQCDVWSDQGPTSSTVLDPVDGRVVLTAETNGIETWTAASGEFLIRMSYGEARSVTVWSMITGDRLWTRTLDSVPYTYAISRDQIALPGVSGDLAFDLATGASVEPADDGMVLSSTVLADGTVVENVATTTGETQVVARDPDGTARWSVPGWLNLPAADDRGDGAVVLVSGTPAGLQALDAETGDLLWAFAEGFPQVIVRADGVVLLLGGMERDQIGVLLIALDEGTGRELWRREGTSETWWPSVISDGSEIGIAEMIDGGAGLVVRNLRTGEGVTAWDLPVDEESGVLTLPNGWLVQVSGTAMAVLAP